MSKGSKHISKYLLINFLKIGSTSFGGFLALHFIHIFLLSSLASASGNLAISIRASNMKLVLNGFGLRITESLRRRMLELTKKMSTNLLIINHIPGLT